MRPIPAPRIGDAHGLMRAIDGRGRLRVDEFITEFPADELFPPELENALGRTRQFVAYARAAGLLREDHGTVELTEIGRRYVRAGDPEAPFDVSSAQAEWLRHLLREKHMTDSIYHGLAIALSLLASSTPDTRTSTLDFGRALSHLGRAGWDNENTLRVQGERHLTLLRDVGVTGDDWMLTPAGRETRDELTLPVHRSLFDLAAQLNPGGPDAVRAAAAAEWGTGEPDEPAATEPAAAEEAQPSLAEPPAVPTAAADDEYEDVGPGAWAQPEEPAGTPTVISTPSGDAPVTAEASVEAAAEAVPGTSGAAEPVVATPAAAEPVAATPAPAEAAVESPASAGPHAEAEVAAPAPPPAAPAARAAPPPAAPAPAVAAPAPAVAPSPAGPTLPHAAIRAAAEEAGLALPDALYAQLSAALAAGKHLLLTGAPGAGKTTLALAVARAAASGGHSAQPLFVTAQRRWSGRDTAGDAEHGGVFATAARDGRWLVVDELDRARLDRALGPLSGFLAGLPLALPGGRAAVPPEGWRVVATWAGPPPRASAAVLRRFAHVAVPATPPHDLGAAAGHDATAVEAVRRLLPLQDLAPLGAGIFLDAARHAAARNAAAPTDEATLAREVYEAYVAPCLGELDDDARRHADGIVAA